MRAQFFFMPPKDDIFFLHFSNSQNALYAKRKRDDAETTLQTRPYFSAKPIFASDGVFIAPFARLDERVKTVLLLRGGRERDRIHHFFQRVVKGIGVFNKFDTLARVRF